MATSHSENLFDVGVKTPKSGRAGTYATAVCGTCGKSEDIFARASAGATLPVEPVAKKFRTQGWKIAGKKGRHTCPACQKKPATPKAAPPPEPTPENRRAILEALEIVFCPAKGFDDGYDDERVALEQGMPRRWVEDIREQFCGPVPPPAVDHIGEARAALKQLGDAAADMADAQATADKACQRVIELQADVDRHLEKAGAA
ncbi:hypothetical protein IWQ55_006191 [Labrenzia sp. EL_208]|nr:hypothetical protein [Labrenzia sp. EL_132]MBG6232957.1 hypothetical protein [Labrenzia sp. EL_208]